MLSKQMSQVLLGGKQVREVGCVGIEYTVNGQDTSNYNVCDDDTVFEIAARADGNLRIIKAGRTKDIARDQILALAPHGKKRALGIAIA